MSAMANTYLERISRLRARYFSSDGFRLELAEARDLGLLHEALRDIGVLVPLSSRLKASPEHQSIARHLLGWLHLHIERDGVL
jgi:hypothetical protein